MSNRKGGQENKKWEGVGDAILKLVVSENIQKLPRSIHDSHCIHYFTSNEYLCSIRHTVPIKFKRRVNNCVQGSKNSKSQIGDEVEYYIAFLYFNFGLESAKRFILSRISVYLKK